MWSLHSSRNLWVLNWNRTAKCSWPQLWRIRTLWAFPDMQDNISPLFPWKNLFQVYKRKGYPGGGKIRLSKRYPKKTRMNILQFHSRFPSLPPCWRLGILVKEILQLPNWIHWLEIAFQTCRFRLNLLNWNEGTHGWVPLTLDRDWKPKSYIENKKGFQRLLCQSFSRWWFQIFFIFTPTWGDDPTRRIFFNWVETTN